ncbi:unnamed protein product, partial [Discosporangium mesarthrocarpum]
FLHFNLCAPYCGEGPVAVREKAMNGFVLPTIARIIVWAMTLTVIWPGRAGLSTVNGARSDALYTSSSGAASKSPPETIAINILHESIPVPVDDSTRRQTMAVEPTLEPAPEQSTRSSVPVTSGPVEESNTVSQPYFLDPSDHFVMSVTFHIACDTEGAVIRYTLDGTTPGEGSPTIESREPLLVNELGSVTVRAVGVKEGMSDSEEVTKTVTVEGQVSMPEIRFSGEQATPAPGEVETSPAFLRSATLTFDCDTGGATIYYTTDGVTVPGEDSPQSLSALPGAELRWAEEGRTVFQAVALAPDMYRSALGRWELLIVAPPVDEQPLAVASAAGGPSMQPQVQVIPLVKTFSEKVCDRAPRVVRGKLLRLLNPSGHFSLVAPPGGCGDAAGSPAALAKATVTAREFEPERPLAFLQPGESNEQARVRLGLDEQERLWEEAQGMGCQGAVTAGLLKELSPDGGGGGKGAVGCAGHVVSQRKVLHVDDGTGLVSFGIRDRKFVVGHVTAQEVLDDQHPFEDLVSGAGWVVRDGLNHVESSVRDGDMVGLAGGLVGARMARTAVGHDREGRLILVQVGGTAFSGSAGPDQGGEEGMGDGLDLYELADVMVEAGAVSAVNLEGGGAAIMTQNHSVIVDPADACPDGEGRGRGRGGGLPNGSTLARCEREASTIFCVHLDPPPVLSRSTPAPATEPAPGARDRDDDGGSGDEDTGDGGELAWEWERVWDLCLNTSENGTASGVLWEHLDQVEEAVH